jgi:hypothetical protein
MRCYTLKARSEAAANLKDLIEVQLAAENSTLASYYADGAKELIGKEIGKILVKHHCRMAYSPAYTAETNALVERSHRTVFETAFLPCSCTPSFPLFAGRML